MSAQNSMRRIISPKTTEYGRPLLSLAEIRDIIADVDAGLDALLELLWHSQNNLVHPENVHILLKPLRDQLVKASDDLQDMRL